MIWVLWVVSAVLTFVGISLIQRDLDGYLTLDFFLTVLLLSAIPYFNMMLLAGSALMWISRSATAKRWFNHKFFESKQ